MSRFPLSLLLLPALVGSLSCSRASATRSIAVQGRILGADGKPVPMAHARIWRDPFRPELLVQADPEGRFSLKASLKPGVYTLDFSGVGHRAMEAALWVDGDRSFRVEARLGAHRRAELPKDLRLEVKDERDRVSQIPMSRLEDGTWSAEVQAPGRVLRARVLQAVELVKGVPFRFGIDLGQGEGFEPTADHNYFSVVRLQEGRAHIRFDPQRLPQGDPLPQLAFEEKDDDLAAAWKVDQERHAIMDRQTLPRTGSREDLRATYEELKAFRNGHADRWVAALAQEARPRVRQALAAALLLFGEDPSVVLKAFPANHAFWAQVDETELSLAIGHSGPETHRELMGILLDRRDPEAALRVLKHRFFFVRPDRTEQSLADLEAIRPGHPVIGRLRADLKAEQARLRPGQRFPDFQLPSLGDAKIVHSLGSFAGKFLLIDFWATWCGPCVADLPALHQAHEAFKGRGLEILSLSLDRRPEAVTTLRQAKQLPMPWKHALLENGTDHPLCKTLQVHGIPRLFLLGPDGKILASDDSLRGGNLERTLAAVLKAR